MSYDTEDQTDMVCPYCGYRDPDSWEETYPDTHECPSCGRTYRYEARTLYTTWEAME